MPQRGAYRVGLHTRRMVDVDPERFEVMVSEALDGIPVELGELMTNVAVTVQHDGGPAGILGLYQGVPLTRRSTFYAGALPDRITIYSLGWERALVTGVEVPAGARVLEIDGPDVWAQLCRRHPLPVTAARRHDWYRATGRGDVTWVQPDWAGWPTRSMPSTSRLPATSRPRVA